MIHHILSALPLLADALGRKYGVRVLIGGDRAFTDGKDIHIPALPLDAEEDMIHLARGYLDHEAAHLRVTDFEALQRASLTPVEKHVWNIFEDCMVEEKLAALYPGCRQNFIWLIRYVFLSQKDEAGISPANDIFSWMLMSLRSLPVPELLSVRDKLAHSMDKHYPGLRMKLEPLVSGFVMGYQNTSANIRLAKEVVKIISLYMEAEHPSHAGVNDSETDRNTEEMSPGMSELNELLLDPAKMRKLSIGELAGEKLEGVSMGTKRGLTVAIPVKGTIARLTGPEIVEAKKATTALRTRLSGMLQASVRQRNSIGRSGRLATSMSARMAINDPRVFARHSGKKGHSTAIHILLDASSSMQGHRIALATQSCFAVAAALQNIRGISVAVTAFPGGAAPNGINKSRQTVAPVLTVNEKLHDKFGVKCCGSTPMAEALWWTLPQLHSLPEERKLLLIVSDGVPDNFEAAQNAIIAHKAHGHEVYGIGIATQAMQNLLPPPIPERSRFSLNCQRPCSPCSKKDCSTSWGHADGATRLGNSVKCDEADLAWFASASFMPDRREEMKIRAVIPILIAILEAIREGADE